MSGATLPSGVGALAMCQALACSNPRCVCHVAAQRGSGLTHCPAHTDSTPSLHVSDRNGKLLVRCHAGCSQGAVVTALRDRGLWPAHRTSDREPRARIAATYPYRDEAGTLRFEVVRYDPKRFAQRRPNGRGGWVWNLNGTHRILYRLPDLRTADPSTPIFIVEGEKDADRLASMALMATTNPGGAGKWRPEYAAHLRGRHVVLLPDNDPAGTAHTMQVAGMLHGVAASIKIISLPGLREHGDVSDFLNAGHTRADLLALVEATSEWAAPPPGAPHLNGDAGKAAPDFNLTDLGNAERFAADHHRDLRYVPAWGWLWWNGRRWALDDTGEVQRRAKMTVRQMAPVEGEALDDVLQYARRSEAKSRLDAMLALAQREPGILACPAQFDTSSHLFNVLNGTLDFHTGALRPHCREDLLTKLAPVEFDPQARCLRWDGFLSRIMDGNASLICFLQRAVGSALTGITNDQVLFILYGAGANGKTTFLETVRTMLGDYAAQADSSTFLVHDRGEGIRNDLARLVGVRFVSGVEVGEGRRLDEVLIKQATGGDTITARLLYHEPFEFRPAFKLFLGVNHKPTIRGADLGIWRRIRLIPFGVTIPIEEQDRHLLDALRDELPGILRWAVEGCLAWQREGLGSTGEVLDATSIYREEMDPLAGFLTECCVVGSTCSAPSRDLYVEYVRWCEANGERAASKKRLGLWLAERGFSSGRNGERTRRIWYGLGLHVNGEGPHAPESSPGSSPVPADAEETAWPPDATTSEGAGVHDPPVIFDRPDDDGRRTWLLAMGEGLGWPALALSPGHTLTAGESAWRAFCCRADDDLITRTVHVLQSREGEL